MHASHAPKNGLLYYTPMVKGRRKQRSARPCIQWLFLSSVALLMASVVRLSLRLQWSLTRYEPDEKALSRSSDQTVTVASRIQNHSQRQGRLLFLGQFGLGHRFSKLSAAVHLAKQVPLGEIEIYFGHCQAEEESEDYDIFQHLFGPKVLQLQDVLMHHPQSVSTWRLKQSNTPRNSESISTNSTKIILVRNDVLGYYAGQSYKNARLPLPSDGSIPKQWTDKLDTDVHLFRFLMDRFKRKHAHEYDSFLSTVLNNHFVIGLHVRAGNGERQHFQESQRGLLNMSHEEFCQNMVDLVANAARTIFRSSHNQQDRRPIIFLATDTASLIPVITRLAMKHSIPVVTFPQARLSNEQGVSYTAWTAGQQCLDGWRASVMDMAILALRADVVVAATRSTFTQIVPLALQLEKKDALRSHGLWEPKFCELSVAGKDMTCFSSRMAWLLRHDSYKEDVFTLSIDNRDRLYKSLREKNVPHKVMLHLPDVLNGTHDFDEGIARIRRFLKQPGVGGPYMYGRRFDPKYRYRMSYHDDWVLRP